MRARHTLGGALAALVVVPPFAAIPAGSVAAPVGVVPTCRGQEATLVGTPHERLTGTDGPDVMVTNGADPVRARDGDDLVCVTGDGGGRPDVADGAGDDIVDAHRFAGYLVQMTLGAGSDRYVGSAAIDLVSPDVQHAGHDRIRTGAGHDELFAIFGAHWTVDADLGPGDDRADVGPTATFDVVGGLGRDRLVSEDCGCVRLVVRLGGSGTWVDGRQHAAIPGFENATVIADNVVLYGSRARNRVSLQGCSMEGFGRGGDDELDYAAIGAPCPALARLHGGQGDDVLVGSDVRDFLYGDRGADLAIGRGGRDLCRAEEKRSC